MMDRLTRKIYLEEDLVAVCFFDVQVVHALAEELDASRLSLGSVEDGVRGVDFALHLAGATGEARIYRLIRVADGILHHILFV